MFLTLLTSLIITITSLVLIYLIGAVMLFVFIKLKLEPIKGVCTSNVRLDNKIVLVTGGNQGIGLETARDLASRGARVIIGCRDRKKAAEAIADIIRTTGKQNIEYQYLDLASFSCVRKFAEVFNQTYDRLDILINNAGCSMSQQTCTEDGIDLVMQVNYLGHFLLTNLLLDKIKASPAGRIVIVSSWLHIFGRVTPETLNGTNMKLNGQFLLKQLFMYSNSKLCDILWTKALAKRLPHHVTVNSLHPGFVKTDIFKEFDILMQKWITLWIYLLNFKTPKEGAQTTIHLAVSEEVANVSGKYFMECKEASPARITDNDEFVEKIWNKSVVLTS